MPASYAHYRFGQELIPLLPQKEQRLTHQFRQLFLTGLQGPDLFFYHNPIFKTKTVKLGKSFHQQTGKEFFAHACQCLTSQAAYAYLLGLLGHYCVDSVCHPFVHQSTQDGRVSHVEMESEFDRFLMKGNRIRTPHAHNTGKFIQLTKGECITAAAFFPPVTPGKLETSVKNMARFLKLLSTADPGKRKLLRGLLSIPGGQLRHFLLTERVNDNCAHLDEPMLELYRKALDRYPVLLAQLNRYISDGTPLGPEFDPIFG